MAMVHLGFMPAVHQRESPLRCLLFYFPRRIFFIYLILYIFVSNLNEPTGLKIFGTVSVLRDFRPAGESLDRLWLVTERHRFCVLGFDASSGKIVTHAKVRQTGGGAHDPTKLPSE